MAARGSVAKENIKNKILEVFEGSFLYDGGKEIRIPVMEGAEVIQIKVTLTAAKTNVEGGSGAVSTGTSSALTGTPANFMNQPTPEEKQAVADLCSRLGITK